MKKLRITIETKSYLMAASGEGSGLIDADIIYNKEGFPILPARRLKGLFRESMLEVEEIMGGATSVVDKLFGVGGEKDTKGLLHFNNLSIKNWDSINSQLFEAKKQNEYAFAPENIKIHFTKEIQQTALDEEGIASHRSLRNYRALKPNYIFEGFITSTEDLTRYENILKKAALQLRYAGTRRNKGFGKIKCILSNQEESLDKQAVGESLSPGSNGIKVDILTTGPVVLAISKGEQFTVFTEKWITGNRLRGLLAYNFIRSKKLSFENAHEDPDFFDVFLSNKLIFSNCVPGGYHPIPLNIHKYKGRDSEPIVDVFRKSEIHHKHAENNSGTSDRENFITKAVGEFGSFSTAQFIEAKINTTFNFHNSRADRVAGRSTEENAGIYYYESIDENQLFTGEISGDKSLISKLMKQLEITTSHNKMNAEIGRSKATQYGNIQVKFSANNDYSKTFSCESGATVYLIAKTPVLLKNKDGQSESNCITLSEALGIKPAQITNASARITWIEQMNNAWQCKSGKIPAYQEGSVFSITSMDNMLFPAHIGEMKEQGFGQILWINEKDFPVEIKNKTEADISAGEIVANRSSNFDALLEEIKGNYEQTVGALTIKKAALDHAKKIKNMSGHLIGRMENMLTSAQNTSEVNEWLQGIDEKPAFMALESKMLVKKSNGIVRFDHPDYSFEQAGNFKIDQLYWLTFFKALRKLNKTNG